MVNEGDDAHDAHDVRDDRERVLAAAHRCVDHCPHRDPRGLGAPTWPAWERAGRPTGRGGRGAALSL